VPITANISLFFKYLLILRCSSLWYYGMFWLVYGKCISEKFKDEDNKRCPTCNIDLGCDPKLRSCLFPLLFVVSLYLCLASWIGQQYYYAFLRLMFHVCQIFEYISRAKLKHIGKLWNVIQ